MPDIIENIDKKAKTTLKSAPAPVVKEFMDRHKVDQFAATEAVININKNAMINSIKAEICALKEKISNPEKPIEWEYFSEGNHANIIGKIGEEKDFNIYEFIFELFEFAKFTGFNLASAKNIKILCGSYAYLILKEHEKYFCLVDGTASYARNTFIMMNR